MVLDYILHLKSLLPVLGTFDLSLRQKKKAFQA